jgi:hypothetical protein
MNIYTPQRFGILLLLALCSQLSGCNNSSSGDRTPPVLQNLVVEIGIQGGNPAGDFTTSATSKNFLEFGAVVTDGGGEPKVLPTFEYRVSESADVVSPMNGVITRITYQQSSDDYAIWIRPRRGSRWLVEIDHVRNLQVEEDDQVIAGQVLGVPGSWGGGLGRVELMVNNGNTHVCPFNVFDPGLIDAYRDRVTALMDALEAANTTGTPFYDQDAMLEPGCNELTISS